MSILAFKNLLFLLLIVVFSFFGGWKTSNLLNDYGGTTNVTQVTTTTNDSIVTKVHKPSDVEFTLKPVISEVTRQKQEFKNNSNLHQANSIDRTSVEPLIYHSSIDTSIKTVGTFHLNMLSECPVLSVSLKFTPEPKIDTTYYKTITVKEIHKEHDWYKSAIVAGIALVTWEGLKILLEKS